MKPLQIDKVRNHFPAFSSVESGVPDAGASSTTTSATDEWSFFENAGGTLPVRYVVERLHNFYQNCKVQPYGHSPMQSEAGAAMDQGRSQMAAMLGLPAKDIVLGPSTTQNFNTLATGFVGILKAGDEIVISEQDHEANIGGWLRAAKLAGATAVFWQVDPESGELELDTLATLINERTRLVAVTHSSNIIGSINPLAEIADLLTNSKHKIYLIADGVSYAPHGLPAIDQLASEGVDAYCFSTYKTFGTHMGIMYVSPHLSEQLTPQCHYFNTGKHASRFDAAGPDHASIAALAGIADYFERLYAEHDGEPGVTLAEQVQACSKAIKTYEQSLASPVLECLANKNVRVYGQPTMESGREANIAFAVNGRTSASINENLASHGIATGNGNFYAPRVLERMGCADIEDGVVRLSFAHYNDATDVNRLVSALDAVLGSDAQTTSTKANIAAPVAKETAKLTATTAADSQR